ncbi:putative disease resistance protein At4g19050 [Magnolia sinica]|uniref:putative disease resistance protein At4g19050 n=1 Tax=Magnolia sinica TaxID=86752 RepID=UPI002658F86F|nr:putative disease resistance protein At4g19050 [Magnolia sinica]
MAGRGGNEAVASEGGLENFPADIKRAGEELLHCLTNPMMAVITVRGFNGVGRWSIVEYAIRKSNDSLLFNVQILVELLGENFSLGKAQKEIARQLRMTTSMDGDGDNEESIDTQVAAEIYKSLIRQKFLLVLGDVLTDINFELIGDPRLRKILQNDSKIVIVANVRSEDLLSMDLQSDMAIRLQSLSMDMLRKEAANIAHSPSIGGHFTPNVVLDCFFYMLLFQGSWVKVERLAWYWRAEGFIITEEGEEEDLMMFKKVEALLTQLRVRSLVERKDDCVRVPKSINWNARDLITSRASTHGRFWFEDSLPSEDDMVEDIRRMAVEDITELSPLPRECPKLSTLILVGERDIGFRILDTFLFEKIQGLRVLDLRRLLNESLPKSASCLHNLRFLKLTSYPHLETLLPSFQIFDKLEFLKLSSEFDFSPSIPDDLFKHMNNLRCLHLTKMQITSLPSSISRLRNLRQLSLSKFKYLIRIPDEIFGHLRQLHFLNLQGNDKLESLPSSLSELVNLKKLILGDCLSLKKLPHLQKLSALEELDLRRCSSLEDLRVVTSSSLGDVLPNLRKLDISKIEAIQRLSFKGCQSLELVSLYGLTNLQVLDLSGTKLKTLPQGISDAHLLRHLNMLDMNQILKINFEALSKLEELNFSQCSTWNSSSDDERSGEKEGARIRVSNPELLQYFWLASEVWVSKIFSRFHICISPCQEDKRGKGKSIHLQRRQFVYEDIGSMIQTRNLPHPRSRFDRCLEIRGGHRSPKGMHAIPTHVELITVCDNAFVQRLSDLGRIDKMVELKECWVERCEWMEIFFEGENESSNCLSCLEKIWLSNLARLRSVCEGTYGSRSFALLKHIHLDYCLKIVTMFSSSVFLQSLETLEIKYCSKLEALFGGDTAAESSLQRLHTVCLWELPRLESICHGTYLSALKKLKVRGCGMLKKLPLRASNKAAASTSTGGGRVEVEGEWEWWDHLKWEDERIQHLINFKDPRPFTQRR